MLHFVSADGQSQHEHVPRKSEITQTQCSRPCGTATGYLHTAIWLGKSQSMLTQVERSSEPGLVRHLPFQRHDVLARGTYVP